MNDTRIVYGAGCVWWDSVYKAAQTHSGLPICPHCGGGLYEMANEEEFFSNTDTAERTYPGYREYLKWQRGKCFKTFQQGWNAWKRVQDNLLKCDGVGGGGMKRYDFYLEEGGMAFGYYEGSFGKWVKFEDHEAEISRLKGELAESKLCYKSLDEAHGALGQDYTEATAELEALRNKVRYWSACVGYYDDGYDDRDSFDRLYKAEQALRSAVESKG